MPTSNFDLKTETHALRFGLTGQESCMFENPDICLHICQFISEGEYQTMKEKGLPAFYFDDLATWGLFRVRAGAETPNEAVEHITRVLETKHEKIFGYDDDLFGWRIYVFDHVLIKHFMPSGEEKGEILNLLSLAAPGSPVIEAIEKRQREYIDKLAILMK